MQSSACGNQRFRFWDGKSRTVFTDRIGIQVTIILFLFSFYSFRLKPAALSAQ